jgi:hypothetical protein
MTISIDVSNYESPFVITGTQQNDIVYQLNKPVLHYRYRQLVPGDSPVNATKTYEFR